MFTIIYEHKLLAGLLAFFLLSSIVCQIISGVIYQNMISESENMSSTENKILKQCKQKYSGYYKLNGKMLNTDVFVDKFLQKICIGGIRINRLGYLSTQFMMLSVLVDGISICLSLAAGSTLFQIIPYYLISILGLYLYFSVSGIIDLPEKKKALKINLVDYLENHLIPRLETEKETIMEEGIKKREKYAKELLTEDSLEKQKSNGTKSEKETSDSLDVEKYGDELEHLLEEFFA